MCAGGSRVGARSRSERSTFQDRGSFHGTRWPHVGRDTFTVRPSEVLVEGSQGRRAEPLHLASEGLPVGQRVADLPEDDAGPRGPECAEQKESPRSGYRALGAKRGLAPVQVLRMVSIIKRPSGIKLSIATASSPEPESCWPKSQSSGRTRGEEGGLFWRAPGKSKIQVWGPAKLSHVSYAPKDAALFLSFSRGPCAFLVVSAEARLFRKQNESTAALRYTLRSFLKRAEKAKGF